MANLLTTLRLLLTIPIVVLMHASGAPAAWTAFGLFVFAMLTDVFDGRLARRSPDRSPLGNYLDPVADKVLLMSVFICLAGRGVIPVWMVLLLVGREFVVDGVRSAGAVQGKLVGSNWMGKTKTLVQTFAISFALFGIALQAGSTCDASSSIVQGPGSRVHSPESIVQSPQSTVHSPESIVQGPESTVHSAESIVQGPGSIFLAISWWLTLAVSVAGVIFVLVFVWWNRRMLIRNTTG